MAYLFQLRSAKTMASLFQRNLILDHEMMLKYVTIQRDNSIRSVSFLIHLIYLNQADIRWVINFLLRFLWWWNRFVQNLQTLRINPRSLRLNPKSMYVFFYDSLIFSLTNLGHIPCFLLSIDRQFTIPELWKLIIDYHFLVVHKNACLIWFDYNIFTAIL